MSIAELIHHLEAHGRSPYKMGAGWEAFCPAHDDRKKRSLSITEGKAGRILVCCHAGCTFESIVSALGLKAAAFFPQRERKPTVRKPPVEPPQRFAPEGTPEPDCRVKRLPPPSHRWPYVVQDSAGKWRTAFFVARYPTEPKEIRPWCWCGQRWQSVAYPEPRPLYRLDVLTNRAQAGVLVVEGEKSADAAARLFPDLVVTTWAGGAKTVGKADWSPLAGRCVVIWPDADGPGREAAAAIASRLDRVRIVQLPDTLPSGWDLADPLPAGLDPHALVRSATEYVAPEEPNPTPGGDEEAEDDGADDENSSKRKRESAATRLVKFADEFAFFHDTQNRAFVRLNVNGHVEIWPVNSTQFRNLLAQIFYKRTRTVINRNALADAIAALVGRACFDSPEEAVYLRIAPYGEHILIDLCDPKWRVVEVTPVGWRILDKSPVAFIRTGAMRPLPDPASPAQGSLAPLWELLNVTPSQRPLVAGVLLNYFHPHGPYFVINLVGEQGTAKSCGAKMLRLLVDPTEVPLRSPPREERDLLVQAANNWCVALDNLSSLHGWLSDGLCRLATGGGHSARGLYTDADEFVLAVKRPVILNGIEDVATRPDLAERALQIELETIPDNRRMSEKELWRRFEAARPVIFSGLLNGLVCALRELPSLRMDSLPRMADAAIWATAGEAAFGWKRGTFITAYSQNLNEGAIASLDAHPVGVAIRQLLENQTVWTGEPAQLLKALNDSASDELRNVRKWPHDPRALSACLRRLAIALRRGGIEADFGKKDGRRQISLCKPGNSTSFASQASQAAVSADAHDAQDANLQPFHDEQQEGAAMETALAQADLL